MESGTEEDFNAYIKDMRKLINTNYTNKDIAEIEEIIDVDNFIKYMAFQIYIVNPDWPHNNVMAWKYTGPVNESVYGMDGKWRFVLRDLDFGLRDPSRNMFETVMSGGLYNNEPHLGQVLKNLLRNKEFNRRFKEHMTKLCTEILTEDVLTEYILNAKEERVQDMKMYRFYFGGSDLQWNNLIEVQHIGGFQIRYGLVAVVYVLFYKAAYFPSNMYRSLCSASNLSLTCVFSCNRFPFYQSICCLLTYVLYSSFSFSMYRQSFVPCKEM